MGLEYLDRVRRTSFLAGSLAAVLALALGNLMVAGAIFAGALAGLANLELVRLVVTGLTSADRGMPAARKRIAVGLGGLPVLLGLGWLAILRLPAGWVMAGFGLPFAVLVLKAASTLLLGSRAWARLTRSRWRGALVVGVIVAIAWAGFGARVRASETQATVAASHHPSAHHEATATDEGAKEQGGKEEKQGEEAKKELGFPNAITFLEAAMPHQPWVEGVVHYEPILYSILVALLLGLVAWAASRERARIPTPLQNLVEAIVEFLSNFVVDILGPKYGPRYVPFLGTLFLYILAMNLFGLIPFMHSPTSSLNVTVALALTVFIYVQYTGFRELGLMGWVDHMLGSPRDVTGWMLAPLMLPIHLLGELAKPISLSCRLFGNIFGEDMLLVAFATLGITMLSFTHLPFGLPLHALFFPLALLGSALQAMVFTVLSTIYLLLMLPHEHHDEGHAHEGEATHAHSGH
jgi:F-type H+-transporting ATPase subunit a